MKHSWIKNTFSLISKTWILKWNLRPQECSQSFKGGTVEEKEERQSLFLPFTAQCVYSVSIKKSFSWKACVSNSFFGMYAYEEEKKNRNKSTPPDTH